MSKPDSDSQGMRFLETLPRRVVTVYAPLAVFVFVLLYSFSHMLQEQAARAQSTPEQLASTQPTQIN